MREVDPRVLLLSAVVGVTRGHLTNPRVTDETRILRRGNAITIALFVGLIATKFGLGAVASVEGIDDGAGFGEVLVMVAVMIAVQAEIIWRRAPALDAEESRRDPQGAQQANERTASR